MFFWDTVYISDAHCCHMGTAIKHPVPDRARGWASECLDVKNYKWLLNPVWHRMPLAVPFPYGNSGRQRVNV